MQQINVVNQHSIEYITLPAINEFSVVNSLGLFSREQKKYRINRELLNLLLRRNITGDISYDTMV